MNEEEMEDKIEQICYDAGQSFNQLVDFALEHPEGKAFLRLWRQGNWAAISREFPEYLITCGALTGRPA